MAKESKYGIGKTPVFRETFNDEQTVQRDGGTLNTAYAFNDGRYVFTGASGAVIKYPVMAFLRADTPLTIRFRLTKFINTGGTVRLLSQGGGAINFLATSGDFSSAGSAGVICYQDGINVGTNTNYIDSPTEITITADDIGNFDGDSSVFMLAASNGFSQLQNQDGGEVELFEIYDYKMTEEEAINLYNNSAYIGSPSSLFDVTPETGAIQDKMGNEISVIDIDIVREGSVYAVEGDGATTNVDLASPVDIGTSFTVLAWGKLKNLGFYQAFAGDTVVTSYPLAVFPGNGFFAINDGNSFKVSSGHVIPPDEWQLFGAVKVDQAVTFYLNGVSVGSVTMNNNVSMQVYQYYAAGNSNEINGRAGEVICWGGDIGEEEIMRYYWSTRFKYTV